MKPLLLLLLLLPLALPAELTLEQAWTLALEHSPTEEAARARRIQADARAAQTRAAWHPQLSTTASGARIDYSDSERLLAPGAPESAERYEANLDAAWILWNNGRRRNTVEAAERAAAAFTAGWNDARERLLADVGRAFTAAQLARANLRIAEEDVAFQERQLENSRRKEDAGLDSRADRLNFEIRKLAAETTAVRQEAEFATAMARLSALLGVAPDAEVAAPARLDPEQTDLPDHLPGGPEVWSGLETTLPALVEASEQVAAAEANLSAVRARYGPEISAFGTLTTAREDDPAFDTDDLGNRVGVQIGWDLWSGNRRREEVREAEAALAEARAGLRELRLQAVAEVKRANAQYAASVEAEALSARTFELSRENRNLVEASYEAGRETLLRLNEAQRDFNNAGLRYASAHLQRQLAWIEALRATGALLDRVRN